LKTSAAAAGFVRHPKPFCKPEAAAEWVRTLSNVCSSIGLLGRAIINGNGSGRHAVKPQGPNRSSGVWPSEIRSKSIWFICALVTVMHHDSRAGDPCSRVIRTRCSCGYKLSVSHALASRRRCRRVPCDLARYPSDALKAASTLPGLVYLGASRHCPSGPGAHGTQNIEHCYLGF
jgi:hypothetical protein